MLEERISVNEKYEIVIDWPKNVFKALRYGEEWRELVGDNLILAMAYRIQELEQAKDQISSASINVMEERTRQDDKWGEQNHEPTVWLGILGEEFGELCQAVNETWFDNGPEERKKGGYENMRAEAVQVAAVAVALIECLDRRLGGKDS